MPWIDLKHDVGELFANLQQREAWRIGVRLMGARDRSAEIVRQRARRHMARAALLSNRGPCPGCGAVVIRDSERSNASPPVYCSKRCASRARQRRRRAGLSR